MFRDKEFLHQKYVVEGLSTVQIAKRIGSSRSTVSRALKGFGVSLPRVGQETHRKKRGQLRYGEKLLNGRVLPHKRELENIVKMKKLRSQGYSYWKIAQLLNDWGVPSKNRARWHATTVMKTLKAHSKSSK